MFLSFCSSLLHYRQRKQIFGDFWVSAWLVTTASIEWRPRKHLEEGIGTSIFVCIVTKFRDECVLKGDAIITSPSSKVRRRIDRATKQPLIKSISYFRIGNRSNSLSPRSSSAALLLRGNLLTLSFAHSSSARTLTFNFSIPSSCVLLTLMRILLGASTPGNTGVVGLLSKLSILAPQHRLDRTCASISGVGSCHFSISCSDSDSDSESGMTGFPSTLVLRRGHVIFPLRS